MHAQHYVSIRDQLKDWQRVWGYSVFDQFSEMQTRIPADWFEYGAAREISEQYRFGRCAQDTKAPRSLVTWMQNLKSACTLPQLAGRSQLSPPLDRGMTPKKKHEVARILDLFESENIFGARVMDIGGGQGHLARHLALRFKCNVKSIDHNLKLQDAGRKILNRLPWSKLLKDSVQFICGNFPEVSPDLEEVGPPWAIGLHTCGRLAWSHLEQGLQGVSLLNVGCCYEKLAVDRDMQRSAWVRSHSLVLTEEALFLANRGGIERGEEEFVFQQRVLRYRFSLQALLAQEGVDLGSRQSVGTTRSQVYRGSFSSYVRDRSHSHSAGTSVLKSLSNRAVDDFFSKVAPQIEQQRFATFLRNLFARPLELAILLDRALYLEEKLNLADSSVRLVELFDPQISPRNVGILVRQSNPVLK